MKRLLPIIIPVILLSFLILGYWGNFFAGTVLVTGSEKNKRLPPPATALSSEAKSPKVNLNTATAADLSALPNVGESRANAIIEYRNLNGMFKNIKEIQNVMGIGHSHYQEMAPYLCVE